jgi:hypothetical protein
MFSRGALLALLVAAVALGVAQAKTEKDVTSLQIGVKVGSCRVGCGRGSCKAVGCAVCCTRCFAVPTTTTTTTTTRRPLFWPCL